VWERLDELVWFCASAHLIDGAGGIMFLDCPSLFVHKCVRAFGGISDRLAIDF